MKRCSHCVMPDTRPDTPFVNGVCAACLSFGKKPTIDWGARRRDLEVLLERGKNGSGYDCIVPSSGGKDSTWQVKALVEMGARPLVVTATTCHLTPLGRKNIDNLACHATTIEVTPNRRVRRKLNRLGMELVGDISWPEHVSIFTTPFRVAESLGIPLIFYGESPQAEYGGPIGSEEARQLTRRWRSEFGGFLGLRPIDLIGQLGITPRDMADYTLPEKETAEAYFLGQFLQWDSHRNAREAKAWGFECSLPSDANWWPCENLDNAQTGIHDHGMYRKYGYGRGCAQIAVDVRLGRIDRQSALDWVMVHDCLFPSVYAEVTLEEVLKPLGVTKEWLFAQLDRFTNEAVC